LQCVYIASAAHRLAVALSGRGSRPLVRLAPAKRSEGAETQTKVQLWGQCQLPGNGFHRLCNLKTINAVGRRFRGVRAGTVLELLTPECFKVLHTCFSRAHHQARRARPKDDLSAKSQELYNSGKENSSRWARFSFRGKCQNGEWKSGN